MLNKLLKIIVDVGVVCLLVIGLTSCASGGGSSGLVQQAATTPPPTTTTTYTPPAWDGIAYTDTNPDESTGCLLYTSPSPRDLSTSRMPSSA